MKLRIYKSAYLKEMAKLYQDTILAISSSFYSLEEREAWAKSDLIAYDERFKESYTLVAFEDQKIVGFGNIHGSGYLDMLYVSKDHQKRGIATKLCNELEGHFQTSKIKVHASKSALSFFMKRGYKIIKDQEVLRHGAILKN